MSKKDTLNDNHKQNLNAEVPDEVISERGYIPPPQPKIISENKTSDQESQPSAEGEVLKGYIPPPPPPQSKSPAPKPEPNPAPSKTEEQSPQSPPEKD